MGVIRDYDAKKGYGFIRCKGLAEEPSWVSVSVGKVASGGSRLVEA